MHEKFGVTELPNFNDAKPNAAGASAAIAAAPVISDCAAFGRLIFYIPTGTDTATLPVYVPII